MALPLDLPQAPELAPIEEWDAMIADYATVGLTVHRHPLRLLRPGLKARHAVTSADLERLPHGSGVSIGGLVVARQRPGTANGVVFLLIEDEVGTVNLIVPPRIYERDRLTVRTEPLVLVDGTLERHAAAGGAINVLVRRMVPLDAADLRTERPAATVKDFSPLDERERRRILEEQPLVAVAGGGAASAVAAPVGGAAVGGTAGGPPAGGRDGALAAVASAGGGGPGHPSSDAPGHPTGHDAAGSANDAAASGAPAGPSRGGGRRLGLASGAGGSGPDGATGAAANAAEPMELSPSPGPAGAAGDSGERAGADREASEDGRPERPVREHGGSEDFRAVAPPVMSFAQGRRR
jgi:error-prone DNA polymerase